MLPAKTFDVFVKVLLVHLSPTQVQVQGHPQHQTCTRKPKGEAGPLTCAHPRTILHEYDELAYKDGEEQGQNGK